MLWHWLRLLHGFNISWFMWRGRKVTLCSHNTLKALAGQQSSGGPAASNIENGHGKHIAVGSKLFWVGKALQWTNV